MAQLNNPRRSLLRSPPLVAFAAVAALFTLAYATVSVTGRLRDYAGASFNYLPSAYFSAILPLFVASAILALAWLILLRLPPDRLAGIVILLPGLLLVGEYLLYLAGFPLWLRRTILTALGTTLLALGPPPSFNYYLASGCIVIGIAALVRTARSNSTRPKTPGAA
jgi:hypothetical protein